MRNLGSHPLTPLTSSRPMQDFRKLDVWHKSHAFTLATYRATEHFPKSETFGLATTLRRGATQLTTKIAEACGRGTNPDFVRCIASARALGVELEYQLLLACDLHFLATDLHDALHNQLVEVRRMLSGVIKARALSPFDTLTDGIQQGATHGYSSVGAGRDSV
jgi:four helix bundle protein